MRPCSPPRASIKRESDPLAEFFDDAVEQDEKGGSWCGRAVQTLRARRLLGATAYVELETHGEDHSGIRSPDDSEAFVQFEDPVRRHDGNVFHQRLRDDLAVEGIRMMSRQIKEAQCMLRRVGQDPQS
jgi:hypothetical protein